MRFLPARGHRGLCALMLGLAAAITATACTTIPALNAISASSAATPSAELRFSTSADRLNAQPLDNSQIAGQIRVFLASAPRSDIRRVEFFLDDPTMQRKPMHVETSWQWDLAGTSVTGAANPWNASSLDQGAHTLTARSTEAKGARKVETATFTVDSATTTSTTTPPPTTVTTAAPPTTAAPTTTTPPPTTTPPVPPPSGGCPAYPAMPNASCTGWQHTGVSLTPYTGPLTITTPGTVIDGKDVSGTLSIQADNVTITRSRVRGHINTGYGENTGILIQDVEVNPGNDNGSLSAIGNSGFTCIRCNVYNAGQGFNITSNVTIKDSYVHDLFGQGSSHNEPIVSNGGGPFTIVHNELVGNFNSARTGGGMSASLALYGDFGQIRDVLVQYNRFNLGNGGSYCVYAGSVPGKAYPVASNTRFLNNRFGRALQPNCGQYGPVTAYSGANGNAWAGNVWDDTGAPVNG